MASFSLSLLHVRIYVYIHIDMHKYINTTCSVHLVLLTCVWFHGWPLGVGETIMGLLPGDNHFSCSQQSLIACSSLSTGGAQWDFLLPCELVYWCCASQVLFRHSGCWGMGDASLPFPKDILPADFLVLCHEPSSVPLFYDVTWAAALEMGTPRSLVLYILTNYGFLQCSPFAAKKSLFDEWWELHVSVGIEINI